MSKEKEDKKPFLTDWSKVKIKAPTFDTKKEEVKEVPVKEVPKVETKRVIQKTLKKKSFSVRLEPDDFYFLKRFSINVEEMTPSKFFQEWLRELRKEKEPQLISTLKSLDELRILKSKRVR